MTIKVSGIERAILMGNEAIARGAIEAGVDFASSYPGTPSSEICETLASVADEFGIYVEWSANEKVAFEVAAGAAIVGARSIVSMKNAGLNVAMDSFMTLPYTGIKGSMVIAVADDPNAHYSSSEQDTRFAAKYAEIFCFEPMDQQEAKDMTKEAFTLSEKFSLPVFLRSVTRISHASGDVTLGSVSEKQSKIGFNKHWKSPYKWIVYGQPSVAARHVWLREQQPALRDESEKSQFNKLFYVGAAGDIMPWEERPNKSKISVLASGLGNSYALEAITRLNLDNGVPFLKIGTPFPLPTKKVLNLLNSSEKVLIVEEGDPMVEEQVRSIAGSFGLNVKIYGKSPDLYNDEFTDDKAGSCVSKEYNSTNVLSSCGEINSDKVAEALQVILSQNGEFHHENGNAINNQLRAKLKEKLASRSSTLCAGCPHLGSYFSLREALKGEKGVNIVNGDIGCYEQGGYGIFSKDLKGNDADSKQYRISSPYEILDTTHVMGSGIGLAMGQAQVGYKDGKVLAVAGDSTFFHATLPALVNAVYSKADITFLVLDNSWTCMTGHQPSPTTGQDFAGNEAPSIQIEKVVKSLGIESLAVVDAYDLEQSKIVIEKAMKYKGPSVVILRRECALQVQRRTKGRGPAKSYVDEKKCVGCRLCLELGCPAITYNVKTHKAGIDEILCVDCGLCAQVCPQTAILSLLGDRVKQ